MLGIECETAPLRAIKGEGEEEEIISRGEDEVLPNRFGASLSVPVSASAPSRTCAGFEEARAVRGTPRVRPAAPPTCSPVSVRRDQQGSASVSRPVRFVSIYSVPHRGL